MGGVEEENCLRKLLFALTSNDFGLPEEDALVEEEALVEGAKEGAVLTDVDAVGFTDEADTSCLASPPFAFG